MKEIYKDIEGYEGLYQVSNLGNVKSVSRYVLCRDGQHKPVYEKIISPGNNGAGYLFVYLWKDNKSKRYYIHQLVAKTFIENSNNYNKINHKDFNKKNNTIYNLEWCDDNQNMAHCSGRKVYVIKEDKKTIIDNFISESEAARTIGKGKGYVRYQCNNGTLIYSDYYNCYVYFSLTSVIKDVVKTKKLKIKLK